MLRGILEIDSSLRRGWPVGTIREILSDRLLFEISGLLDQELFTASAKVHFDAVASSYLHQVASTAYMCQSLEWQMREVRTILDATVANTRSDDVVNICDLGAGAAAISSWPTLAALIARARECRLTCLDISDDATDATRRLVLTDLPPALRALFNDDELLILPVLEHVRKCKYWTATLFTPQYHHIPRRSQHVVICAFVLHHQNLRGKFDAANMIKDIMQENGIAIVIDEYRTYHENLEFLDRMEVERTPYALESFVDDNIYANLFEGCGFGILRRHVSGDGKVLSFVLTHSKGRY